MEKQLLTRPNKTFPSMREVYYEGGGEVPEKLSGLYTTDSVAQVAIKDYLENRPVKAKANGKRSNGS